MNNIKSLSNKDRYGNMFSIEFFEEQSVPMLMMIPDMPNGYNGADTENHPGNPKGTDTVPAWLTPGENVVNAEASRLPGNQEKIDEMNEQGRAIQQAQGGPIPTYESDGGTVYAAEGSKVYTKRMPDGRMGVWKGNTFLNYVQEENDGMLKNLRDKIGWGKDSSWSLFNSDGGQVPAVYAQRGSFITDELLDRIRRVESGGDPNATSEAGAMGQYQIMPATAAQPGYGVTPLAAEDIRDPAKSREFARQYLMGIAANNPDFTEDEVITAYHSGVGNVRKAKEGTEALGPRGQAYANKVADASGTGPDAFGVNRRRVATVPNPNATPPVPREDNIGFWDFITTPTGELKEKTGRTLWETITTPTDELKYKGDPSAVDTSEDSKLFDLDQIQRAAQYPLEMFGVPVGADAPGVEVPNIFSEAKDAYFKFNDDLYVKDMKKNEEELRNTINERKANKQPISPELVEAHKKAVANVVKAEKQQADRISDKKKITESEEKAVAEAQSYVPEEGKAPPKPEDTTKTTDRATAAAAKVKAAEDIVKQNPTTKPVTQSPEDVNAAGKQKLKEDPTFAESITQGFKDLFSEMFEPKEIARMIVNYAGSRALGYDHGASLNYSAKTYTKTIAAQIAQRQKDVRDKDFMEAYTKESLDKYLETGDRNDLIERPTSSSATNITGQSGTTFDRFTGTEVPVYKMGSGKDARLVVKSGDSFVDATSSRFEVVNPKLHDLNEIRDEFQKRLGNQVDEINKTIGKDDPKLDFSTETLADEARALYVSNRDLFRMSNKNAVKLSSEITLAQKDFLQDYKKHIQNPSEFDKPTSIEGYYNKRIIKLKTASVFSYNDVKNTNPENLDILEKTLSNAAANAATNADGNLDRETYVKVYRQLWTDAKADWKEVKNKDAFKADGYDPIIQWMITEAFK